ncbi:MAG: hypothetical protein U0694_13590 [Anaerolineae bacterium]
MKKQRERYATIEFVALHPLEDCVFQLRDARSTDIEPTFERESSTAYRFRIRKLRRDRGGRDFSMVEARVYLRSMSANETVVVGSIRFSWRVILSTLVFGALLLLAVFLRELWLGVVIIGVILSYWAFVWWDQQTLVGLVKRRLGETWDAKATENDIMP